MHSKIKGNIGQFAVSLKLAELGFSIFTEEGDISKVDLIAEKKGKFIRIQCKAKVVNDDHILYVDFRKCGPNYCVKYTKEMFDFFGVYDLTNTGVYFIPSSVLDEYRTGICLRVNDSTKNNQSQNINYAKDYLPEIILKDYL